jgi:RNA polymerase sigma-B factor
MDGLLIETRSAGAVARVQVRGELDLSSATELRRRLADALVARPGELVVDIHDVRFLDCTAVGVLLEIRSEAASQGCAMRLSGAAGVVLEVLEVAGVAKRLGVYAEEPAEEPAEERSSREFVTSMLDTMSQLTRGGPEHAQIRTEIVTACTPYATALARRFAYRGEPFDDLRQVAMIGLLKAVDGYDPHRGREFIAYATPTILGELRRHFRDQAWAMTVPRRFKEMRLQVNAARERLAQGLGRSPSVAELSAHLQVEPAEVLEAIEAAQAYQSMSLFTPLGDDERTSLVDLVGSGDPDLDAVEDRNTVSVMLSHLPEREQRILLMRFYGNMTQSQIAGEIGVSQMHVSRLLKGALEQLREELVRDG